MENRINSTFRHEGKNLVATGDHGRAVLSALAALDGETVSQNEHGEYQIEFTAERVSAAKDMISLLAYLIDTRPVLQQLILCEA